MHKHPSPSVEVCFSPKLFPEILTREHYIVVLVDILRATTSICAAFQNGVSSIIPVDNLEEAERLKNEGYLVASEQDGRKVDFADFGNSAFSLTRENIGGRTLVYCTTNGTRALSQVASAERIAIGAFINLSALNDWLVRQNCNVVILCSGWKNMFCLEDTLFAGALADRLIRKNHYHTVCDSTVAACDLWAIACPDVLGYIEKAAHRHRLKRLGLDDVLAYSFTPDLAPLVPVMENGKIVLAVE